MASTSEPSLATERVNIRTYECECECVCVCVCVPRLHKIFMIIRRPSGNAGVYTLYARYGVTWRAKSRGEVRGIGSESAM